MKALKERFTLVLSLLLLTGVTVTSAACSDDDPVAAVKEPGTIVDVAIENNFETLVAAVQAAGLVETLQGTGPFTVFAPTDEAFAKLPEGTVASLLLPENKDQLVAILTYHVVSGTVTSDQVVNLNKASTVQGADIAIAVENGKVKINDATVVLADVEASNGVVHVIDTVLLPPTE